MGNLVELRALFLQHNSIGGEIPSSISKLINLIRLNLADNKFTGKIPVDLKNLRRLRTLYLENNALTGQIPDLSLPNLVEFNVSYNSINGSIPKFLEKQPVNSFLGINDLCGGPFQPCREAPSPSPATEGPGVEPTGEEGSKKHKLSGGTIAGIVIGCVVGFLILLLLLFLLCRRKKAPKERDSSSRAASTKPVEGELVEPAVLAAEVARRKSLEGGGRNGKTLVFFNDGGKGGYSLDDLLTASAEVLGKGSFGTTYKAMLERGVTVAVKRLKDVNLDERELKKNIEVIGKMNHENLVPLKAYYFSKDEKLLVYEYMPLGSLSSILHGNRNVGQSPLNWSTRASIALSSARGLSYIHSTNPTSSHGNIKSSNVLLCRSIEDARVSDHGLANLVGHALAPAHASGYRAPEVTNLKTVSQKADVYSFGILLLELLTGRVPLQATANEDGLDLPKWVRSIMQEESSKVFDQGLVRDESVEEESMQLLKLALDCTAQVPDSRPTMSQVVSGIEVICRNLRMTELAVE